MTFKNQKIIITGASSGIGYALVLQCLEAGAFVYGISYEPPIKPIKHPRFSHKVFDLTNLQALNQTFDEALNVLKGLDILFLNAGSALYKPLKDVQEKEKDRLYQLNVKSILQSYDWLLKAQEDQSFKCIITSSVMAYVPFPGYAFYSATKAFIMTYFKAASYELKNNQSIHLVYPVATHTNFFNTSGQPHKSLLMQTPEKVAKKILKGIQKNKKKIILSRPFEILYHYFPFVLKWVLKREQKQLNFYQEKK